MDITLETITGIGNIISKILRKYTKENNICLEIEDAVDKLFNELYNNGTYVYVEDMRETALDQFIEYSLKSSNANIEEIYNQIYPNGIKDQKKEEVIKSFFSRLTRIITEIQANYVSADTKIVCKKIDLVVSSVQKREDELVVDKIDSTNNSQYESIGLLSIMCAPPIDNRFQALYDLEGNLLDLSSYFNVYYENHDSLNWKDIVAKINCFIANKIYNNKNYLLSISACYSAAYAFGKLLGLKNANIALLNKSVIWDYQYYKSNTTSWQLDKSIEPIDHDLNVIISVGDIDIKEEVLELESQAEKNYISFHFDGHISSNNDFWNLVKEVNTTVSNIVRKNKIQTINLYYKGMAELLFALGQRSNNWCQCQIKEYTFKNPVNKRYYFNGVLI